MDEVGADPRAGKSDGSSEASLLPCGIAAAVFEMRSRQSTGQPVRILAACGLIKLSGVERGEGASSRA